MSGERPGGRRRLSAVFSVFQANRGLIASVLRRYAIGQVDIEDLMQETIVRALKAEQRTNIREPRRFLVGIAKNIARDELQRRSRMSTSLLDDLDPAAVESGAPAVDEVADMRGRMQLFGRAVSELPPQCRKVFVLKHVYGASHKEIAGKLGIAVSTVEKHVALGLRRCREMMLKEQSEGAASGRDADDSVIGMAGSARRQR